MRGLVAAHRKGPEGWGHPVLVGGEDAVVGVGGLGGHTAIVVTLTRTTGSATGGLESAVPNRHPQPKPAMNRLPLELHRLYIPHAPSADTAPTDASLVDAQGQVRAMVLGLARPADWAALARVWHGVQADLGLPAPAIAVAGQDGYQLWFSLAAPLPVAQAAAFLQALRRRYLGDVQPQRVTALPAVPGASAQAVQHARLVPAEQGDSGLWSAFVAPDLAPVFNDEPWLDSAPNLDGQASLLGRLVSIPAADFAQALARLEPAAPPALPPTAHPQAASAAADQPDAGAVRADPCPAPAGGWRDPQRFLLDVINDDRVAMGLRIAAASALLPYFDGPRRP